MPLDAVILQGLKLMLSWSNKKLDSILRDLNWKDKHIQLSKGNLAGEPWGHHWTIAACQGSVFQIPGELPQDEWNDVKSPWSAVRSTYTGCKPPHSHPPSQPWAPLRARIPFFVLIVSVLALQLAHSRCSINVHSLITLWQDFSLGRGDDS